MIECTLRPQKEFATQLPEYDKERFGRYLGSNYGFPGSGVNKWAVGVYIDVDHESLLAEGKTPEDIVRRCIEFLNTPPPRKKYQKKKPVPRYGTLNGDPVRFRLREDGDGTFIEAILVTDQRKSKQFWGSGDTGRTMKKRGRPRKERK